MPKVNGRDIFETKPWLNDDPQNIDQYSAMVDSSAPTGTIEISANGEYDVSEYATADVQVEGGGGSSYSDDVFTTQAKVTINASGIGSGLYTTISNDHSLMFYETDQGGAYQQVAELEITDGDGQEFYLFDIYESGYIQLNENYSSTLSGAVTRDEEDNTYLIITGDCTLTFTIV